MVEQDRENFVLALKQSGDGSLLRGWRRELDGGGELQVNFLDFCKACKGMRVVCNATELFGKDSPNELTLDRLAPREGKLVFQFRRWMTDKFGGPGEMFAVLERPDSDGKMTRQEFIDGVRGRGFEQEPELLSELFNLLDLNESGKVAMEDIMFLEMDPKIRKGAIQKVKLRAKIEHEHILTEFYFEMKKMQLRDGHRLAPRGWHAPALERLPEVVIEKRAKWKKNEVRKRIEAVAAFNEHVEKRYGNGVRAWRRGLDPTATFRLTRSDFCKYCRRANLEINAELIWKVLDRDNDNVLRLEEISPGATASLARFWQWAMSRYKSCSGSWEEVRVAAKPPANWASRSSLPSASFLRAIKTLEWPGSNEQHAGSALVSVLDLNGCGIVSRSDLEWLDKWTPAEWLYTPPDSEAWQELAQLLLACYGRPLKAWKELDTDGSNNASWFEFNKLCDKVGFTGNRGGAWRSLDQQIQGAITLHQWHPPSARLLQSFKDLMDTNYGCIRFAFQMIDTDGSGNVSYSELRRACRRLGWERDVRLIFNCLGAPMVAGGRTLLYKDVAFLDNWPLQAEVRDRGRPRSPPDGGLKRASSSPSLGPMKKTASTGGGAVRRRVSPTAAPLAPLPRSCPSTPSSLPDIATLRRLSSASFEPPLPPPKAASEPPRRFGVGCYREEALASLRATVSSLRFESQQLESENRETRTATEKLKAGTLRPVVSPSGRRGGGGGGNGFFASDEDDECDEGELTPRTLSDLNSFGT